MNLLTTKIHTAVDLMGIPIKFILSEGNKHDVTFAKDLISNLKINTVIADKGYDANYLRTMIPTPIIPYISRRKNQVQYNKELYKRRNVVERFFLKIKAYRKIATRYEQTARNYLSLLIIKFSCKYSDYEE